MKKNEIKELLVKEFVGKKYNNCVGENPYSIMVYLRDYLKLDRIKFVAKYERDRATLVYQDYAAGKEISRSVAHIKVKKQQGEYKGAYGYGSRYEWLIKDIEVTLCDNMQNLDIEDVVANVIELAKQDEKNVNNYQALACEILKAVKKICAENNTNDWLMVDYINDNYFALNSLLETEEK